MDIETSKSLSLDCQSRSFQAVSLDVDSRRAKQVLYYKQNINTEKKQCEHHAVIVIFSKYSLVVNAIKCITSS